MVWSNRLPDLRARHPHLHIDIDTGGHALTRLSDGLDAAIVLAREIEPPLYGRRLGRNRIIAIGNRDLALSGPRDLANMTILLHRDMQENFMLWRQAAGIPGLEPRAIDLFDSGQLMLESAAEGLGVAFMLESHFEDAHDERLVHLFDLDVESPYSYWFVCRPRALLQRPVKLFHDWLMTAVAEPGL